MEKFCVVRDYGGSVGGVTCADFYAEQDAREYLWMQKMRPQLDVLFVWRLYKEVPVYDEHANMIRMRYEELEG